MKRLHKHRLRIVLILASLTAVLIAALLAARPGAAAALLNGSSYTLDWWTVDGGGSSSASGGGYTLAGTAGQPDAGIWEDGGYSLIGGFWDRVAAMFRTYLPLVVRDWMPNSEQESNDTVAQANGPATSGLTYYGTMPEGDPNDYFYFDLSTPGSAELWLTHIPSGCDYDLVLRNVTLTIVGYSGNVGAADEHIDTGTLTTGRYYVQVYHRSTAGSSEPYHLRVVYP